MSARRLVRLIYGNQSVAAIVRLSAEEEQKERKSGLPFFPPLFQIRLSTSKQQEIHCDPQSFAVHALIRADGTRCSNNFPRYRFGWGGGPSVGVLISPGQTQALTCHPPQQVVVIKLQPLRRRCWNRTKVKENVTLCDST